MIVNENGDVKVRTDKGAFKWIPKAIAQNKNVMKAQHLEIVPKPDLPLKPPVEEAEKDEVFWSRKPKYKKP